MKMRSCVFAPNILLNMYIFFSRLYVHMCEGVCTVHIFAISNMKERFSLCRCVDQTNNLRQGDNIRVIKFFFSIQIFVCDNNKNNKMKSK